MRRDESEQLSRDKTWRVTLTGMMINLLLAGIKIAAGAIGHSQAVLADGVHSLSDMTTDISVLLGSHFWTNPPDSGHPYGHQRIETLVTTGIGITLLAAGGGIAYHTLSGLHTSDNNVPGIIALSAAGLSIVSKEALYRWTAGVGRDIKSSAVIANGLHHRTDALSSIPVVIAIVIARWVPAWSFLDQLAGTVISIFILWSGWTIVWPALKELVDTGASRRELEQIKNIVARTKGVNDVHGVRTRYLGGNLVVSLRVLVDGDICVAKGHKIAESVEDRLLSEGPDVIDVVVHIEPQRDGEGTKNRDTH